MQENENINEEPVDQTTEEAASEMDANEGLLVDAARAVGSALGQVAGAIGGGEDAESAPPTEQKHRRQEKIGLVTSDKMQKTVVVRVERQVQHPKYRRYIRRRSKFMAHNELGAQVGDMVKIVETRPLSARKRWRVAEIVQKAR